MTDSIDSRFQRGPNPGGSGNPGGVYNTPVAPQIQPGYYGQQVNQGRYRPPTLGGDGTDPTNWNDYGGYSYNVPNHYGVGSGWQSPQMSPFPQFARNMPQINAERTRRGLRPLTPLQIATGNEGATIANQRPARNGSPAPEIDMGQIVRSEAERRGRAMREWLANGGDPNYINNLGLDYPQPSLGNRSPYLGPRETHVGGPNDQAKQPAAVNGGVKGPAAVPTIREPLDDWQWQMPRFRGPRWGRY